MMNESANSIVTDEVFDVEDLSGKAQQPPEHARRFRIRIDKEHFVVESPEMTGREVLELVHKDPVRFKLVQRVRGGQTKVIKPHETVDFRKPGIERFNTMAVDQTEGQAPRREFAFTADETDYLNSLGLEWSTLIDGGTRWLIVRGHPVPTGYNHGTVDVAIQISPGYPDSPLDMAFLCPGLARTDGKVLKATQTTVSIGGRSFQRWSRHRTPENPWRAGVDNIATHLLLVEDWLSREFT